MLKKRITYTDYDGNQRSEDFYFNLSKAEIAEMALSVDGGLGNLLKKIVDEKDNRQLMSQFKTIILKAYGEKSLDGKRFVKSADLSEAFAQTEAFVELFMTFFTDDQAAAAFVRGIMPAEIAEPVLPSA